MLVLLPLKVRSREINYELQAEDSTPLSFVGGADTVIPSASVMMFAYRIDSDVCHVAVVLPRDVTLPRGTAQSTGRT